MKSGDEELEACLHVAERSLRMHGRPRERVEDGDQAGFQDDVILLEIDDQDKDKFNAVLYCVNCHYYWPDNVSIEEASNPMAHPRAPFLWDAIMSGGPIKVYKSGSASGITAGYLVSLADQSPPGWYERDGEESNEDNSSENEEEEDFYDRNEESEDEEDEEDEDVCEVLDIGDDWLGKIKWSQKKSLFPRPVIRGPWYTPW